MARPIEDRYRSMEELALDLRAYLEQRVVKAHAKGPVAELRKWIARNRAAAALVLLLFVGVILGAIGSLWRCSSWRSRTPPHW